MGNNNSRSPVSYSQRHTRRSPKHLSIAPFPAKNSISTNSDGDDSIHNLRSGNGSQRNVPIAEYKVLLLGTSGSGKSTIFKHLMRRYGKGFDDAYRTKTRKTISENVITSMQILIEHASQLPPDVSKSAENILTSVKPYEVTKKTARDISNLWASKKIQDAYQQRNLFQVSDSVAYFFEKIDELSDESYVPNDADILRCQPQTTLLENDEFKTEEHKYCVYSVGGQSSERRDWVDVFKNVRGVIFVADCSSFDKVSCEDEKVNCLDESIKMFGTIVNSRWFQGIPVVLMFSKPDILRQKLRYKLFKCPTFGDAADSFEAVSEFLTRRFRQQCTDPKAELLVTYMCLVDPDADFSEAFGFITNSKSPARLSGDAPIKEQRKSLMAKKRDMLNTFGNDSDIEEIVQEKERLLPNLINDTYNDFLEQLLQHRYVLVDNISERTKRLFSLPQKIYIDDESTDLHIKIAALLSCDRMLREQVIDKTWSGIHNDPRFTQQLNQLSLPSSISLRALLESQIKHNCHRLVDILLKEAVINLSYDSTVMQETLSRRLSLTSNRSRISVDSRLGFDLKEEDSFFPMRAVCDKGHTFVMTVKTNSSGESECFLCERVYGNRGGLYSCPKCSVEICKECAFQRCPFRKQIPNYKKMKKYMKRKKDDAFGKLVDKSSDSCCAALLCAVNDGSIDMVQKLLDYGVQINPPQMYGTSYMVVAARTGHLEMVEYLIENGVEIDAQDDDETSALMFAASLGKERICKNLLKNKASVGLRDLNGRTALSYACIHGHQDLVHLLVKHKADVNAADLNGSTSIFHATVNHHFDLVKYLIYEHQAMLHRMNKNGLTVFDILTALSISDPAGVFGVLNCATRRFCVEQAFVVENEDLADIQHLHSGMFGESFSANYQLRSCGFTVDLNFKEHKHDEPSVSSSVLKSVAASPISEESKKPICVSVLCKVPKFGVYQNDWYELSALQNIPFHPNVINLIGIATSFEFGEIQGLAAITPYKEGGNLEAFVVEKRPFLERDALRYSLDMCRGVAHVHRSGYCHNDIALQNFLLTEVHNPRLETRFSHFQEIQISGFSLSRKQNSPTHPKLVSWRSASPESLLSCIFDFRSDLWMLGWSLFEMIQDNSEDKQRELFWWVRTWEVLKDQFTMNGDRLLKKQLRFSDQYSESFKELVRHCCQINPKHRMDIDDLVDKMEEMLDVMGKEDEEDSKTNRVALVPRLSVDFKISSHLNLHIVGKASRREYIDICEAVGHPISNSKLCRPPTEYFFADPKTPKLLKDAIVNAEKAKNDIQRMKTERDLAVIERDRLLRQISRDRAKEITISVNQQSQCCLIL